ncbi:MAG: SDR family NAD(P)-dependent oxidoreductase [Candidatus Bathyarchaeia archaeon]
MKGVFVSSKYALRQMMKQKSRVVVNIASEAGLVGQLGVAACTASKCDVILLTKQMAIDYAPYGIRVNCIAPCNIDTPMFTRELQASNDPAGMLRKTTKVMPLGRLGKPEEVAYAAVFLASDEASFTTGAVLTVDAGVTAGGTHTYPHD